MNTGYLHLLRTSMLVLLAFIFESAFSQENYIVINGVLKDERSGDRVSFATISIPNTGIGTVSNSEGEFTLKVDRSLREQYFVVSHVSYATARFKLGDGEGRKQTYYLTVKPVELNEVRVLPDDPRIIVEIALKNISSRFSNVPNMMKGFYRESIMQNRDYISISEAVVDIYKASYTSLQKDQVRIYKSRKGANVKKADTLLVQLQGGPNVLLLLDIIKNQDLSISFDNLDNYSFQFESPVNINDRPNWVIQFSPKLETVYPLYYGKLYISQDDIAITRAEFSLDLTDPAKAASNFIRKKPMGVVFLPESTSYLVSYQEEDYRYYLHYVRVELKFKCDWKKRLFKKNYTLVSEMAITGRSEKNINRFSNQEVFKSNMIFTSKVDDLTDVNFWGENNIIEPEKSIEDAIRKLAKGMAK